MARWFKIPCFRSRNFSLQKHVHVHVMQTSTKARRTQLKLNVCITDISTFHLQHQVYAQSLISSIISTQNTTFCNLPRTGKRLIILETVFWNIHYYVLLWHIQEQNIVITSHMSCYSRHKLPTYHIHDCTCNIHVHVHPNIPPAVCAVTH